MHQRVLCGGWVQSDYRLRVSLSPLQHLFQCYQSYFWTIGASSVNTWACALIGSKTKSKVNEISFFHIKETTRCHSYVVHEHFITSLCNTDV